MNDNTSVAAGGISLVVILFSLVVGLALYLFVCFCAKRICERCGHNPGILIWIPIVQFIPLLTVAKQPLWVIVLLIIPCTALFAYIFLWFKLCEARGKSGFLAIPLIIPIWIFFLAPYLAFSE